MKMRDLIDLVEAMLDKPMTKGASGLPEFVYHGTSSKRLRKILSTGMRAESHWGSLEVARYFARGSCVDLGGEPIVFRMPLRRFDPSACMVDEEMIDFCIFNDENDRHAAMSALGREPTWEDNLRIFEAFVYAHPMHIARSDLLKEERGVRRSGLVLDGMDVTRAIKEELLGDRLAADLSVQEELACLGEDDIFEMANLPSTLTGVPGTIFISTAMGSHGPRVKYFAGRPGKAAPSYSVTIAEDPVVVASSLPPKVVRQTAPAVFEWVRLNRVKLLAFWYHGETMMADEVAAFQQSLQKVSSR